MVQLITAMMSRFEKKWGRDKTSIVITILLVSRRLRAGYRGYAGKAARKHAQRYLSSVSKRDDQTVLVRFNA